MTIIAAPSGPLRGRIRVPGDKSISHRALILGALAQGETVIRGLLEADDVLRTAAALRTLGVEIERENGSWRVLGGAWSGLGRQLYMGNSGTGARLLMGAAAGQGIACAFSGDASLRGRPMARVTDPLGEMGARFDTREGRLPVALAGGALNAIRYRLPKPSAQVKSAILLAALGAEGKTVIEEPVPTRDHTERMLAAFGASLDIEETPDGGRILALEGGQRLTAAELTVPADPSSAAFPLVAACTLAGSEVDIEGVLMNPRRTGLLGVLRRMGARIEERAARTEGGERVCDLRIGGGPLHAVQVRAEEAPDMIDEFPILAVAAACAEGTTRMEGLEELRVKESDRLAATAALLEANGVACRSGEDWLEVDGRSGAVPGGGQVEARHDHRIAMAALVLGLAAQQPVEVDEAGSIGTSFPAFVPLMRTLGAMVSQGTA